MELKFLADAMLGKLTRFLRIFGYDTVYANDLIKYYQLDPVSDEKLIEYAKNTNRIIITRDQPLYNKFKDICVFLEGEGTYNYLNQLKAKLGVKFFFNIESARCSICNSTLERVNDKNLIKDQIKRQTFEHYEEFYRCINPNCRKIFWEGSHIEDILKNLKKKVNTTY